MKKEYICPYCFTKHKMYDVKFMCEVDTCNEEDPVFSKYWNYNTTQIRNTITPGPTPGFFAARKPKMPSHVNCQKCSAPTSKHVCATCHSNLPLSIADSEDNIISVIGSKQSGKSHYLAVLIEELRNYLGDELGASVRAVDSETEHRFNNKFKRPIYEHKKTLAVTQSASTDTDQKRPLLFIIKFKSGKEMKMVTLAFFDTAGEDLKSQSEMSKHANYLTNSSGIICLVDPLQIQAVRDEILQLNNDYRLPTRDLNAETFDILSRTTNLIREKNKIAENKQIEIPFALAFSKIDSLNPILPQSSKLLQQRNIIIDGKYNLDEFEVMHEEIDAHLKNWGHNSTIHQLSTEYKDYAFFGLTALGHEPDEQSNISKVEPRNVIDPILWVLWKKGLFKGGYHW